MASTECDKAHHYGAGGLRPGAARPDCGGHADGAAGIVHEGRGSLVYLKDMKQLCYRIDGTYYNNLGPLPMTVTRPEHAELAGSDGLARKPIEGKVYGCLRQVLFKGVYVCKDGDLVLLSDKTEVINSLTSDRTDAALSAAQGKALKSQVDAKLNKKRRGEQPDFHGHGEGTIGSTRKSP